MTNLTLVLPNTRYTVKHIFRRNAFHAFVTCAIYFIGVLLAESVHGQAGALDPTFVPASGLGGTQAVAIQSDGKIISGGGFTGQPNNSRLNIDGSRDLTFSNTGIDNQVRSIAIQPDGKIVLGGDFEFVGSTSQNRIARLNPNGSLDATFNTGTGASFSVHNLKLQSDGRIVIVGTFTSFNGVSRNRVARLNADGSVDTTFDPGTGTDGFTQALALQNDGKILIGGNFTSYNGTGRNRIARINADGTLDATFNPGTGANNEVRRILIQNDGKIIIVGNFTAYNGVSRIRIARLNSDGTLDTSFNPGSGGNDRINAVVQQPDGKLIVIGDFITYNSVSRNRIARLNVDGTLDTTFDPGSGANAGVSELARTGNKVVIVGGFSQYNGTAISTLARVHTITDTDGDNVDDAVDNCPGLSNPDQANADGDSKGDACDGCPNDPNKIAAGICGCGTPDTDTDGDITADCLDGCPNDPNKIAPGDCGCGIPDGDSDGDDIADCNDVEECDGLDNDGDSLVDDDDPSVTGQATWYIDSDGDGYGTGYYLIQCLRPANGYLTGELISVDGDCDDDDPMVFTTDIYITTSGPLTFCQGDSVVLTASGGSNYSWSNGDIGLTTSIYNTGLITLTATSNGGCSNTNSANVIVNPVPNPVITIDGNLCANTTVQLTTGSFNSYNWLGPDGLSETGQNLILNNVDNDDNGIYSVIVSNSYNCIASTSIELNVLYEPVPGIVTNMLPYDSTFNLGNSITFSWAPASGASGYDYYLWQVGDPRPIVPTLSNTSSIHVSQSGISYGTEYLWQVISKNTCYSTEGDTQFLATRHLPDLTIDSIQVPDATNPNETISLTWRVTNTGNGATGALSWKDRVYLSFDESLSYHTESFGNTIIPPEDILLGTFGNLSYLLPGQSYLQTQSVRIPYNVTGTYFLFIITDNAEAYCIGPCSGNERLPGAQTVDETNEQNNFLFTEIAVAPPNTPDLAVTSVGAPTATFGGSSINVTYTVTNEQPTPTNPIIWLDAIYLSPDSMFDISTATLLHTHAISGLTLDQFESYTRQVTAQIPYSAYGTLWIHVMTDYKDDIFESTFESNNDGTALLPIEVTLFPPIDLAVTTLASPLSASSGQEISVSWTVKNQGADQRIGTTNWTDRVYFSTLSTFNSDSAQIVASIPSTYFGSNILAHDSSYSRNTTFTVPKGIDGIYYVYVFTDANESHFEYLSEGNNILRSNPIAIALTPYPDLIVSDFDIAADTVMSGSLFNVSWIVANQGTGSTDASWKDRILRVSPVLCFCADVPFATFNSTVSTLAAGSLHSRSVDIVAPDVSSPTTYELYFKTDATDVSYEYQFENNNTTLVKNIVVIPIPITTNSDLEIDSISVPSSANSGQPISFTWRTRNVGPDTTYSNHWMDQVYLSTNQIIDPSDIALASFIRSAPLASNETYLVQKEILIPNGFSGNYFVLVKTNERNEILNELDLENNTAVSPLVVHLSPSPDLIVTSLNAPSTIYAGQSFYVHYSVKNKGAAALSPGVISDKLFISNSPSTQGGLQITGNVKNRALSPQESYSDSALLSVPAYLAGNYFIVLNTDNANAIYEHNAESNNSLSLFINILSNSDIDVDLEVTQFEWPDTMLLGDAVGITYTLQNHGSDAVQSTVRNAAYASADIQYNGGIDPLLGYSDVLTVIPPGGTIEKNLTAKIRGIDAGDYFGVTRTNILNQVYESNYDNNSRISVDVANIDARALTLEVPVDRPLRLGDFVYYKVDVDENLDLLITLTVTQGDGYENEVYAAFERTPSQSDFDFKHDKPGLFGDQRVLVPGTEAGSYYIFIKTNNTGAISSVEQHVEILAQTLPFSILSVSPNRLGQGIVTTIIDGAGFRDGMQLILRENSDVIAEASITEFTNSMSVKARWDLTYVATGVYDLVAINPDLSEVVLVNGITVETSTDFQLGAFARFPDKLRVGRPGVFTTVIENIGNIDIPVAKGDISFLNHVFVRSIKKTGEGFLLEDVIDTTFVPVNHNKCCLPDDDIKAVPYMVRNMTPGQKLTIQLELDNFKYNPTNIRVQGAGATVEDFILGEVALFELIRQNLLEKLDTLAEFPEVQSMILDPIAFRDSILAQLVYGGLLTQSEIDSIVFPDEPLFNPQSSGGLLSLPNLNINSDASYLWHIYDPNGEAGNLQGWDLIHTYGDVNITASPLAPCEIDIVSYSCYSNELDFLTSWEPGYDHCWPIIIAEGTISGFDPDKFQLSTEVFTQLNALHGGSFELSISNSMDTVYLCFISRTPDIGENGYPGGDGHPGKPGGKGGPGGNGDCSTDPGIGGEGGKGGKGIAAISSLTHEEILPGRGGNGGKGGINICSDFNTENSGGDGGAGGSGGDGDYIDRYVQDGGSGGDGGDGGEGTSGGGGSGGSDGGDGGPGGPGGVGDCGGDGGDGGDGSDGGDGGDGGPGGNAANAGGNGGDGGNAGSANDGGEDGTDGDGGPGGNGVKSPGAGGSSGGGSDGNGSPGSSGDIGGPAAPPGGGSSGDGGGLGSPECGQDIMPLGMSCEEMFKRLKKANCAVSMPKVSQDAFNNITRGITRGGRLGTPGAIVGAALGVAYSALGVYNCLTGGNELTSALKCGLGVVVGSTLGAVKDCGPFVCKLIDLLKACDPNEIIGPPGVDSVKWISSTDDYHYTINFENDSTLAETAAQRVVIRQKLHPNVDPFSLKLGDFGFHNQTFSVPGNTSSYSATLSLAASLGVDVEVTAGLDIVSGEVFWVFQAIDPNTGIAPYDPLAGFLAVNDAAGNGQGFVSYTIKALPSVETGDSITAQASIVFDVNDPISTNTWVNLIDAVAPVSQLSASPQSGSFVDLHFSTSDDASGFQSYDLYMSKDFEDLILIRTDETASVIHFEGEGSSHYDFFSRAKDRVNNIESLKSFPDVSMIFEEVWYLDADGDGYGDANFDSLSLVQPGGYIADNTDCNDNNANEHPGQVWYQDQDGDLFSSGTLLTACLRPSGYLLESELLFEEYDCDDANPNINPLATEVCNGIDDNCNELIDDEDPQIVGQLLWYADLDQDGFGDADVSVMSCLQPSDHVGTGTDCDDALAQVNPEATEIQDAIDNDCDGLIDEGLSNLSIEAGDCIVVYNGYAPSECTTLSVNVEGGISPFTYAWSNGGISNSNTVCPEETTLYSITVTDNNGLTAQDVVTVQVVDITCGNNKVSVCHIPPGNPENPQTLCISVNAVASHLDEHGDYLGTCDFQDPCEELDQSLAFMPELKRRPVSAHELHEHAAVIAGSSKHNEIQVYPNPTDGMLKVKLPLFDNTEGVLRVLTVTGRELFQKNVGDELLLIDLSEHSSGIYLIEVKAADGQWYRKIVKL